MGRRRVTFAASAIADLDDVRSWYAARDAREAGERLVREMVAQAESLVQFPMRGRMVPEIDSPVFRELIHPPFRIVYRLDGVEVRVVRVWRSERLLSLPTD